MPCLLSCSYCVPLPGNYGCQGGIPPGSPVRRSPAVPIPNADEDAGSPAFRSGGTCVAMRQEANTPWAAGYRSGGLRSQGGQDSRRDPARDQEQLPGHQPPRPEPDSSGLPPAQHQQSLQAAVSKAEVSYGAGAQQRETACCSSCGLRTPFHVGLKLLRQLLQL